MGEVWTERQTEGRTDGQTDDRSILCCDDWSKEILGDLRNRKYQHIGAHRRSFTFKDLEGRKKKQQDDNEGSLEDKWKTSEEERNVQSGY